MGGARGRGLQKLAIGYAAAMGTMPEPELVVRNGKAVSVILPIEVYQEMIERLEDADDIAWLREARSKPQAFRKLDEVLADLGMSRDV